MAAKGAKGGEPTQSPTPTDPPPTPSRKGRGGLAATRGVSRLVDPHRRQFVVAAPEGASFLIIDDSGDDRTDTWDQLDNLFKERLPKLHSAAIETSSTLPDQGGGRVRILFTVDTLKDARKVIRERHLLKGSGISIHDVLSPDEQLRHDALWPRFLREQRLGKKAQFNRAELRVDGVLMDP